MCVISVTTCVISMRLPPPLQGALADDGTSRRVRQTRVPGTVGQSVGAAASLGASAKLSTQRGQVPAGQQKGGRGLGRVLCAISAQELCEIKARFLLCCRLNPRLTGVSAERH